MSRGLVAEIDYLALRNNISVIKKYSPNAGVIAMLKADAYGHGIINIASALPDVNAFGVACLEEAMILRRAFFKKKILLLEGVLSIDEIHIVLKQKLDIIVHTDWQIKLLKSNKYPINVWLKINTGMNRLGFSLDVAIKKFIELINIPNVNLLGIVTHFSSADCNLNKTLNQISKFNKILQEVKYNIPIISACNSAGIIFYPMAHYDWVRPGIMLYGSSPSENISSEQLGLLPVMTLKVKIIAKHFLKKNEKIGYSEQYTCPEDMPIGILSIGYGDGFPIKDSDKVKLILNGKQIPIIGRVSMDMIAVDLRNEKDAAIGDEIIIWGKEKSVDLIAEEIGTISYELFTSLSTRVPRIKKNYPKCKKILKNILI